ncbi:AI-2E family transporter [Bacillus sp. AGMB 02131]|uniref:AI-2E family transporter n=1 Tax=Peribacillus faecalis TaxID=2772559 RepID=A0A927CVQ7_9BACI|nr:AI-2E family transporter [Peribacillus faecalis]MBD3108034.1 AI-2E family transporter [Peribacillus faecalis]
MEFNKHNIKSILFIIACSIILLVILQDISRVVGLLKVIIGLISPLLIGFFIAFILNVLLKLIENVLFAPLNKKKYRFWMKSRRSICLLLTIAVIIGAVFILLFQVIPELKRTYNLAKDQMPSYMHQLTIWNDQLSVWLSSYGIKLPKWNIDWEKIMGWINQFTSMESSNFFERIIDITGSIFSGIFNIVTGFIFAIYILLQKEKLFSQVKQMMYAYLPINKVNYIVYVSQISNRIFSRFVTGQFTEAIIIGVLCFIGMKILSMPHALVIGSLVGFTALIPVFGAFIGTTIGAFLILMENPMQALWFIVFIIVLQRIEGNFIYPKVVGSSIGLPSMWVLLAVLVGASISGIIGMMVAVPLFAVIYTIIRDGVAKRLKKKGIPETEIQ